MGEAVRVSDDDWEAGEVMEMLGDEREAMTKERDELHAMLARYHVGYSDVEALLTRTGPRCEARSPGSWLECRKRLYGHGDEHEAFGYHGDAFRWKP
jgi:hypothetical protein